jgi:hypothetical protein
MNQQRQQPQGPFQDLRLGLNLFTHAVDGYATGILPFMRRDFGTSFFGFNAVVAVIVMLIFGALENSDDMLRYMFLWMLFVLAQRLDSYRLIRQGKVIHTGFAGESFLAHKLVPKARRKTVQMLIEPAICLIVGAFICPYSPGVGKYLIVGAFAVMVFNGILRANAEQRVRQMNDAYIEQRATARMFRGQDDDF